MKQQIDALTGTRGIAALLVVVFHFGCTYLPFSYAEHFFRNGNLAVSYFFILSGFVMYHTYGGRQVSYKDYMRKRIARIAPLYWFALLLSIILAIYIMSITGKWAWRDLVQYALLGATFTQAYVPGKALTLNVPGWSLSVEMFFYLLFPLLLVFANRTIRAFLWMAALLYIATQVWHIYGLQQYKPADGNRLYELLAYFPAGHLNQFVAGIAGAWFYKKMQAQQQRVRLYPFWVFILIIFVINYMPGSISMHNGLLAPLFVLLITGIALHSPAFLRSRPMVYLGEISFGIYILQLPLHNYFMMLDNRVLHLPAAISFYIYVTVLIMLSAACYHIIEKPFRKIIAG